MLRQRVIALILLKGDLVVQSFGFNLHLPIGKLDIVLEYLELWDVDEVIVLDIDATKKNNTVNFDMIKAASKKIFVPLTIGGGISSVKDIELALHNGADKVAINAGFFNNDGFIEEAVQRFGSQCIVLAADVMLRGGSYFVWSNNHQYKPVSVTEWLRDAIRVGAGEIFINSIDNDGKKTGFDMDLMEIIEKNSSVPLIAAGGAGCPFHIKQLFDRIDSAAAIGNILHHKEHSVSLIKGYLVAKNKNVRGSHFLNYNDCIFNPNGELSPTEHLSIFFKR